MPRPCAVESHARRYKNKPPQKSLRCHGLAPWSLTIAATKTTPAKISQMPRPCAVESHARHYKHTPHKNFPDATALRRGVSRSPLQTHPPQKFPRCHGLAPWSLTLAATKTTPAKISQMPRPRAVESHARRYKNNPRKKSLRCHGLAPWSLTLAATKTNPPQKSLRCHRTLAATKTNPAKISQMPRRTLATTKTNPRKNLSDATARSPLSKPSGTIACVTASYL